MMEKDEALRALLELVGEAKRQLEYFQGLGLKDYGDAPKRERARGRSATGAGLGVEETTDAPRREPARAGSRTTLPEAATPKPQPEPGRTGSAGAPPKASSRPKPEPDALETRAAERTPRAAPAPKPLFADLKTPSGGSPMTRTKDPKSSPIQNSLFGDTAPTEPADPYDLPENETLEEIRADLGDCTRCKLSEHRTNIVFGEGNPDADLMFVGEGPGADEDATGRPFVGRAGQLLDRMIAAIGLRRHDVYIANVIKSRPPGNRAPEPDEVQACAPFLYRQINAIKPKLIVALGASAAKTLLDTKAPISKLRGRFFDFRGTKLLPTFHPAFLLRSPNKKKEAWEDLKRVRDFLQGKAIEE